MPHSAESADNESPVASFHRQHRENVSPQSAHRIENLRLVSVRFAIHFGLRVDYAAVSYSTQSICHCRTQPVAPNQAIRDVQNLKENQLQNSVLNLEFTCSS